MIAITRALARQLQAVLRKSVFARTPKGLRPPVVLQAGRDGLRVRTQNHDAAVEYQQPGSHISEVLALPAEALEDFAGRPDTEVTLEGTAQETVQARWDDSGVPQLREYQTCVPDGATPFPDAPEQWTDPGSGFLKALDAAAQSTARNNARYTLEKLQLRGKAGAIAATDGRQLLVQGGFSLPWHEDLLVPALGAFGCRELSCEDPVALGRTATHVSVRVGLWTFFLATDSEGRYPNVDAVFPARTGKLTTCRLAPQDTEFLARTLPRLPGQGEENAPVTLDLGETVVVRARAEGQSRSTEVVLSASEVTGAPVRCCVHRQHLARALELGFTEIRVVNADAPVVCEDRTRKFAWMTLEKGGVLVPNADALRLVVPAAAPVAQRTRTRNGTPREEGPVLCQPDAAVQPTFTKPRRERRRARMTTPAANGITKGHGPREGSRTDGAPPPDGGSNVGLMEEAQALKEALRDAYGRVSRLVLALQRQRKHSKLLATTLTSLRQLQHLDA